MKKMAVAALLFAASVTTALGAEIKVLAIGALQPGLARVAEQYKRDTGDDVTIQVGIASQVATRLAAGESADVLIATPDLVEQAIKDGRVAGATAAVIGRIGIGIAVRIGANPPNVATVDAFKRALLAADSIVYNQGSSGLYLEKLFEQMGIGEQIKTRTTRYAGGGEVLDRVLQGKGNDIGLAPITAIKTNESRGLRLVPIPAEVQNYTSYTAVVMTRAQSAEAAGDFIRYMTAPAGKQAFAATGVD